MKNIRNMPLQLSKDLIMTCIYIKTVFDFYRENKKKFPSGPLKMGMSDEEMQMTYRGAIEYLNLIEKL